MLIWLFLWTQYAETPAKAQGPDNSKEKIGDGINPHIHDPLYEFCTQAVPSTYMHITENQKQSNNNMNTLSGFRELDGCHDQVVRINKSRATPEAIATHGDYMRRTLESRQLVGNRVNHMLETESEWMVATALYITRGHRFDTYLTDDRGRLFYDAIRSSTL